MASQERKETSAPRRYQPAQTAHKANPATTKKGEKLKQEIDGLVDEIDTILKENSEVLKNYYQLGGQ